MTKSGVVRYIGKAGAINVLFEEDGKWYPQIIVVRKHSTHVYNIRHDVAINALKAIGEWYFLIGKVMLYGEYSYVLSETGTYEIW